ncbi:MAG: hypothetical protein II062_05420 [Oscillospiraceae bacterium]|nr:hypothetical protein [Oscillospiraceae bacterium]
MKKTMLILCAVALVLIILTVGLLLGLFSTLRGAEPPAPEGGEALAPYLAENWPVFRLREWNAATGELRLDYPLRFSYAQMQKYGAAMEELQALPAGNLETVAALKTAVRESLGVTLRSVTVYGCTNDGQIAYTVYPDGAVEACWDEAEP